MDKEFFAFGIVVMCLGGGWPNRDNDLVFALRESFENGRIGLELRSVNIFFYARVGPDSFVPQLTRRQYMRHDGPNRMRQRHPFRMLIVNNHHSRYAQ